MPGRGDFVFGRLAWLVRSGFAVFETGCVFWIRNGFCRLFMVFLPCCQVVRFFVARRGGGSYALCCDMKRVGYLSSYRKKGVGFFELSRVSVAIFWQ